MLSLGIIDREREIMEKKKIDFVSADEGGIKMWAGLGSPVGWSDSADGIATMLKTAGLADTVFGSSTMDFASEEGFENDGDAKALWGKAIEIYNWEVNGVA